MTINRERLYSSILQYIFFFFLGSFVGYIWEVALLYVQEGQFCNRGFLYGPWLPVYGVGAVLMLLLLRRFQHRPVLVFLLAALVGSAIELAVGRLLDSVWELRYWDYSALPLNLHGYISLYSVLAFGIAGLLWVCVIARLTSHLWRKMPARWQNILITLLVLAFLIDCAAALIIPNSGRGVTF